MPSRESSCAWFAEPSSSGNNRRTAESAYANTTSPVASKFWIDGSCVAPAINLFGTLPLSIFIKKRLVLCHSVACSTNELPILMHCINTSLTSVCCLPMINQCALSPARTKCGHTSRCIVVGEYLSVTPQPPCATTAEACDPTAPLLDVSI